MNTTVWLISFTDSNGKRAQTVHTHNCVADFRTIDPNATAQEIDCAAVAELIEDANRWRAVTAVYAGFQTRGDQMAAYISTPQWGGDWSDFNNAIDRHFEINGDALANVGSAS